MLANMSPEDFLVWLDGFLFLSNISDNEKCIIRDKMKCITYLYPPQSIYITEKPSEKTYPHWVLGAFIEK